MPSVTNDHESFGSGTEWLLNQLSLRRPSVTHPERLDRGQFLLVGYANESEWHCHITLFVRELLHQHGSLVIVTPGPESDSTDLKLLAQQTGFISLTSPEFVSYWELKRTEATAPLHRRQQFLETMREKWSQLLEEMVKLDQPVPPILDDHPAIVDLINSASMKRRALEDELRLIEEKRQQLDVARTRQATKPKGLFARLFSKGPQTGDADLAEQREELLARQAELSAQLENCLNQAEHTLDQLRQELAQNEADERHQKRSLCETEIQSLQRILADEGFAVTSCPDCLRHIDELQTRLAEIQSPNWRPQELPPRLFATPSDLLSHPLFQPPEEGELPRFPALLCLGADWIGEEQFFTLTGLAEYLVLVQSVPKDETPYRNGKPLPPGGFFPWAWSHLHRRPYIFQQDRITLTLPSTPGEPAPEAVRIEPVLDAEGIELVFHDYHEGVRLQEIRFRPTFTVLQIKQYLAQVLDEGFATFPAEPEWSESESLITCEVPGNVPLSGSSPAQIIRTGHGISETVIGSPRDPLTTCLTFSRDHSWDLASAQAWVACRSLPAGRTRLL
jgi:hypothetical protein